jgi:hypothetical protein
MLPRVFGTKLPAGFSVGATATVVRPDPFNRSSSEGFNIFDSPVQRTPGELNRIGTALVLTFFLTGVLRFATFILTIIGTSRLKFSGQRQRQEEDAKGKDKNFHRGYLSGY